MAETVKDSGQLGEIGSGIATGFLKEPDKKVNRFITASGLIVLAAIILQNLVR